MEYNIVTNLHILTEVKKYKNFTKSLGFAATVDKGNSKILSEKDKFAFFYNKRYKTTIYGEGYIGDINFYNDFYIKEDQLAIYFNQEEFIFDFNWKIYGEKGIEWYLGYLLKDVEFKMEKLKQDKLETLERPTSGDPYKLVKGHPHYNPGNVTFDDVKAYKEAKRTGLIK